MLTNIRSAQEWFMAHKHLYFTNFFHKLAVSHKNIYYLNKFLENLVIVLGFQRWLLFFKVINRYLKSSFKFQLPCKILAISLDKILF